MADIAMCKGKDCKVKETCYRNKARPTPHWQSYFTNEEKFEKDPEGKCRHYWKD